MTETLQLCMHVTRRNWTVYKKNFISNISPTIADPVFFILALGVGLGSFVAKVEGRTYIEYLAPGLVVSTALFTAFFESSYGFYVRMSFENIFKAMLATPIGVREILIGEYIWIAIKGAVMVGSLTIVLAFFGLVKSYTAFFLCPLLGAMVSLPCGAIGLLATSYVRSIDQFQSIYSFLISPLFFFSGIFFPLSQMPKPVLFFAQLLPLHHGVQLAHLIFWGSEPKIDHAVNVLVLLGYTAGLGYWSLLRIRRLLIS